MSVHLDTSKFSFSVCGPLASGSFYFIPRPIGAKCSVATGLGSVLAGARTLGCPCGQIGVLCSSPHFAPIPLRLFRSRRVSAVFCRGFPGTGKGGRVMLYGILKEDGIMVLFTVSGRARLLLARRFPATHFFSATDPLARCFTQGDQLNGDQGLCACVHRRRVRIFYFSGNGLLLVGSFPYGRAASHICCLLCM